MTTPMYKAFTALTLAAALSSCSDEGEAPIPEGGNKNFILAVTPVASTAVADYLLTAEDLESGMVSALGNGVEQDGTYRYYVTHNDKFFSMLYGQGDPGAVTTYNLKNGELNKLSNFQTETVQAFTPVNDDILLLKVPRNINSPLAQWFQVNTNSLQIENEGTINAQVPSGNGETAHFSWITQVGDKVFAPYFSIKGCCDDSFGTNYPDSAWVAVYSYPDMQLEKVIKDDRSSFIGRYFTPGLGLVENGDVYAFSASVATTNGELSSTKPSAITRIKAGTTEFDQSYYFNVEEASGGYNITDWFYIGDNTFIVNASTAAEKGAFVTGTTVAIVNVVDKTFKKVSGLPAPEQIDGFTTNNYTPKDGRYGYIGVNLKNGESYVYKIDAVEQNAVRGLQVEGGVLTAIEYLDE